MSRLPTRKPPQPQKPQSPMGRMFRGPVLPLLIVGLVLWVAALAPTE